MNEKQVESFLRRTQRTENGCWKWIGAVHWKTGRPLFQLGRKQVFAHRAAYRLVFGEIPDSMCICHHCDNKLCVNPDHLFVGTQDDNMKDMVAKGRQNNPIGESNGRAKLTEDDVQYIRKVYKRYSRQFGSGALAKKYGVDPVTIRDIVNGKLWPHVT